MKKIFHLAPLSGFRLGSACQGPRIVSHYIPSILRRAAFQPVASCLRYSTAKESEFNAQEWLSTFSRETIPRDQFEISFARSGGPGGQNVNKVNTKVDMRFALKTATWLPEEVKANLRTKHSNRITKRNEFFISSERHRTQHANIEDCIDKIFEMVKESAGELVEHEPSEELLAKIDEFKRVDKEKKMKAKERLGSKKASRKRGRDDY
ncbi:peptidyl-tRNA hydrolase domain protein [Fimicolochytrium jonesii]|uniref:peptidyl-tRNA hydrolase domain protein n=1 Tax=Fimicolochytrium jonesii TaxID=1396493 RepID=UPI0022FEF585|nr:peptidyl-tRNA hydrolase domain protein [Fimicolochytrium jonesii]KAI8817922.1 peptidyl-tRNA hydrolase domain protein [Fimicolochytrium jonesii]